MKVRYIACIVFALIAFSACQKNTVSKIPSIALIYFGPDSIKLNRDTAFLEFRLTDGDGDLGNDPNSTATPIKYDIYIKDFRYDTGFAGYFFPAIDHAIEDPKKGLEGTCLFAFLPSILTSRSDSLHLLNGDTTRFEVYIEDRAGDTSNHIFTSNIIMRP